MTVPGPAERFLHYFDGTADLGVDLTATNGQVGAFAPSGFDESLVDLTGSASTAAAILPAGHVVSPDFAAEIWARSELQELLDDILGVTPSDRRNSRVLFVGWMAGDVIGELVDCGSAYLKTAKPDNPHASLTKVATAWAWASRSYPSHILHDLSEETADGDTEADSIDNAAASAAGGIGFWGYTALDLDGGTALAPRVIDSEDDITYGELISFTPATATTGGGEEVPVSGAILRYVACDWDFTGTPGGNEAATFRISFYRA